MLYNKSAYFIIPQHGACTRAYLLSYATKQQEWCTIYWWCLRYIDLYYTSLYQSKIVCKLVAAKLLDIMHIVLNMEEYKVSNHNTNSTLHVFRICQSCHILLSSTMQVITLISSTGSCTMNHWSVQFHFINKKHNHVRKARTCWAECDLVMVDCLKHLPHLSSHKKIALLLRM